MFVSARSTPYMIDMRMLPSNDVQKCSGVSLPESLHIVR